MGGQGHPRAAGRPRRTTRRCLGGAAAPFDVSFLDELASHLGVPAARIVRPGPARRFHTAGLVAAIRDVAARPTVDGGEWILLVAAGAGISAGGALIRR